MLGFPLFALQRRIRRKAFVMLNRPFENRLPRLLYFGDVPVCNTVAGGSFLYRLLSWYPADRLAVWAPSGIRDKQLPGVSYLATEPRFRRVLRTRFGPLYCAWITWRLYRLPRWVERAWEASGAEAVLTISHAGAWAGAWQLAERKGLPLLMLAHDDHAYSTFLPKAFRQRAERDFAVAFRSSAARFCISQAMADAYQQRYGVTSQVIYPTRDPAAPVYKSVSPRAVEPRRELTICYSGSVHGEADIRYLVGFAEMVAAMGHRMLIVSPQHAFVSSLVRGSAQGVTVRAPIEAESMHKTLRAEVDVFLVTASFDESRREETGTLFPSKLADYSAVGAPVLVWAPEHASISRFVRENPDSAELVTSPEMGEVRAAIERLVRSPARRRQLGERMIEVSGRYFSAEAAWATFRGALGSLGQRSKDRP